MGAMSRRKGSRGQLEARRLLEGRDWLVSENCAGRAVCDFIADDPQGRKWAVEVKHTVSIELRPFRQQAKAQAKAARARFLLMCRIPDTPGTWLVEGTDLPLTIWRAPGSRFLRA